MRYCQLCSGEGLVHTKYCRACTGLDMTCSCGKVVCPACEGKNSPEAHRWLQARENMRVLGNAKRLLSHRKFSVEDTRFLQALVQWLEKGEDANSADSIRVVAIEQASAPRKRTPLPKAYTRLRLVQEIQSPEVKAKDFRRGPDDR